jgi:mannose-6-phosphate isomerase-like protein (cupin superfamily)
MRVANANFAVKAGGDVLFIPKAVPHAFKNQGTTPAVAIVVFTPAFDGKDTAPVVK